MHKLYALAGLIVTICIHDLTIKLIGGVTSCSSCCMHMSSAD